MTSRVWRVVNCYRNLGANGLTSVPDDSFAVMQRLRYLWLDRNQLTHLPLEALANLSTLEAL